MMAAEAPVTMGFVNRLPEAKLNAAAIQPLFALALLIESPVIDLLSTATTLAKGRASYAKIRRFTLALMLWTGVVHALVALTPLYDLVMYGLLRLPPEVGEAARFPMALMIPWSPAIGWRRHLQGVLIRAGTTRAIGWGTGVRLVTIVGVCSVMFASGAFSGAVVAASALSASVVAEALFVHFAARPALAALDRVPDDPEGIALTTRALLKFHLPLTLAMMVLIATNPLVTAALARLPDSVLALAGWQNCIALAFLLRTVTFALPEVVIRFYTGPGSEAVLRRFCLTVGGAMTGLTLLLCLTGLDRAFFSTIQGSPPDVVGAASLALLLMSPLPLVNAGSSYVRGCLTAERLTSVRLLATVVSVITTVAFLALGAALGWTGVAIAAVGTTAGQVAELVVLAASWARRRGRQAPA